MSTFVYEGGGGGQKSPENRPRGLCMPPNRNGKKNVVIAWLSNKYNERLPKIEPFFHILAHCVKVVIFISMSRNLH